MYAHVPGIDEMLMQRAFPMPLGTLTRTPAPELSVLVAPPDMATAIPFAFAQLDKFSVVDVANIALAVARRIDDAVENSDDEDALRVGASGLVCLTHLSGSPTFLDATIPAFLTAFPELPAGDAFTVVVVPRALIAVPKVTLVLVALLIKDTFAMTITSFIGRDGRFGCSSCDEFPFAFQKVLQRSQLVEGDESGERSGVRVVGFTIPRRVRWRIDSLSQ
jgi:hypothetical protein